MATLAERQIENAKRRAAAKAAQEELRAERRLIAADRAAEREEQRRTRITRNDRGVDIATHDNVYQNAILQASKVEASIIDNKSKAVLYSMPNPVLTSKGRGEHSIVSENDRRKRGSCLAPRRKAVTAAVTVQRQW